MSASNLVDPLTNKIYDQYIPQGGGVSLTKGQLITANGANVEVPFPTVAPADGSVLSWDSTEAFGLKYIAIPGVTPLDYQELLSANPANQSTKVPAPTSNNYVLTSDNTLGVGSAGMAWKALGGSGVITAKLPLVDSEPVQGTNQLAINFSATVGEIPYGNGTALEGALTNAPTAGQILGVSAGVPTWIPAGGSGTVTANLPLVEGAGAGSSSLVSINFGATVGEIPYGNGTALIGALTNVPTAGQILGISAGVPTWIPAGGSGTVTANLPLVEGAGVGNSSLVSIGFSTADGEIPYGTGTANIGALLAPPTDPVAIGKVLTYAGTPSILEWRTPATPVGGDVITLHSNVATTPIPKPTDKDEQLILVAQEIGASWNLVSSNLPPPFDKAYQPELRFKSSSGQQFLAVEQIGGGTPARREIALYTEGLNPNYLITTFVFQSALGPTDNNAFITCACNGIDQYGVDHFASSLYANSVILGGRFNGIRNSGGGLDFIYNICALVQNIITGIWSVGNVINSPFGGMGDGYQGIYNNNSDLTDVGVFCITPFASGALAGLPAGGGGAIAMPDAGFLVGGTFTELGAIGPTYTTQTGYFNMLPFFVNGSVMTPAQTILNGFAIGATPIQTTADGAVRGILFDSTSAYMWLTGDNFTDARDNGSSLYSTVPPNCLGFVLFYPVALNPGDSAWGQLGAINPGGLSTNYSYDIKPSTALANHIIVNGDQAFLKDITVPTAGTASYTAIGGVAIPVAVGFPLGCLGYVNSIALNVTITTPLGPVTGDFMLFGKGSADQTQYVGYLTTATGTVLQPLDPIPCGPNSVAIGTPPQIPSYGINNLILATTLTIGGDVGEYEYDASVHANIDFTCVAGVNIKVPAGTANIVTARFGNPYNSQSFIASSDLAYWIQIGGTNTNLTYL